MVLWAQLLNLLKGTLNKNMHLVIGLSNPGNEYANTPHNIGLDSMLYFLAEKHYTLDDFQTKNKLKADILKTSDNIIFARLNNYMNLSGESVRALKDYYNIDTENIIILYDDIAFPLGTVKLMQNRGAGGHNGLKSINQHIKDENFIRIRIGVNSPLMEHIPLEKFVLHKFTKDEKSGREDSIKKASEALKILLADGLETAQNKIH